MKLRELVEDIRVESKRQFTELATGVLGGTVILEQANRLDSLIAELERRLDGIETAVKLAEAADAVFFAGGGIPEVPKGTAMLPHDFIPRRTAYRAAKEARKKNVDLETTNS
jgi:hypothetical protein